MKKYLYLLLPLLIARQCTKKAKIDLPKAETRIVVTCFISPEDSIISAVVRLSTPKFGKKDSSSVTDDDIRDALVQIRNETSTVTLPFDKDNYFYKIPSADFPVVPGSTYTLNVTTTDGKK